jgi:hypothetical protein
MRVTLIGFTAMLLWVGFSSAVVAQEIRIEAEGQLSPEQRQRIKNQIRQDLQPGAPSRPREVRSHGMRDTSHQPLGQARSAGAESASGSHGSIQVQRSSALFAIPLLIGGCALFVGLGLFAFWLWMLIDCLTKEFPGENDKIVWVLVIALLNWIGALVYLIVGRPKALPSHQATATPDEPSP